MEVVSIESIDLSARCKGNPCSVCVVHIKIKDLDSRAGEMLAAIQDTSWILPLDVVGQISFKARSQRTIEKLVRLIQERSESNVTAEFGEYLVSDSAQSVLSLHLSHKKVPLAELLKEKVSGNPGFDFHTESVAEFIAFGEAKYSGSANPYTNALEQIGDFIGLEKDSAELVMLQNFVSVNAVKNYVAGHKSYVAAFSINSESPGKILSNAVSHALVDPLLDHKELYIVGVEIDA